VSLGINIGVVIGSVISKVNNILFSLSNRTSIIPQIGEHYSSQEGAGYVLTDEDFEFLLPSNAAKFYKGRYAINLLEFSEDFSNSAWTKEGSSTATSQDNFYFEAGSASTNRIYQGVNVGERQNKDFVIRVTIPPAGYFSDPTATIRFASSTSGYSDVITPNDDYQTYQLTETPATSNSSFTLIIWSSKNTTVTKRFKVQLEDKTAHSPANKIIASEYTSAGVGRGSELKADDSSQSGTITGATAPWASNEGTGQYSISSQIITGNCSSSWETIDTDIDIHESEEYKIDIEVLTRTASNLTVYIGNTNLGNTGSTTGVKTFSGVAGSSGTLQVGSGDFKGTFRVNSVKSLSHGCNVDGIQVFDTELANTVTDNVLSEAVGALLSPVPKRQYEPERENKCTNYNANPDVSLTNMTKGGDAAATLTRVDDSTELESAGLSGICSSGYVFKLDNSGGSGDSWAYSAGTPGNANTHTVSMYARATAGTPDVRASGAGFGSTENVTTSSYVRYVVTGTPAAGTEKVQLTCPAGAVGYFILNQLEEAGNVSSPIVTAGAAVTRNAVIDVKTWPSGLVNDFSIAFEYTHDAYDDSAHRYLFGVGTATDLLRIYINSSDGKLAVQAMVSSSSTYTTSGSALAVGTTYNIEFKLEGGNTLLIIDSVDQTDTESQGAMGWSDPELSYIGSDYNGASGQICKISDVVIKQL